VSTADSIGVEKDENRSSLILKVFYGGLTVLMTGDLGLEGEQELLDYYADDPDVLHADVLKIGHHGSRYSTGDEFLAAVSPKVAVFQVGKNNFGHPHPSIIDKCLKKGIIVYRNDKNGAIIFAEEDEKWHIRVLLRKNMHIKE
jgi:competence protein ComEC